MEHAEHVVQFHSQARTGEAWELVEAVDAELTATPEWADLKPAAINLTTADGALVTFRSMEAAAAWVSAHSDEPAHEIMTRWTQDGQNSTVGQASVTIRVSSSGILLVTGASDQAVADFEARVLPHLPG